jgi:phosphocarrier protein HPr
MYTEMLSLTSIETVKKFVCLANKYNFPISLLSEKYKIDAKSIMGIFSLDLSKPVQLQVESECPPEFKQELEEFKSKEVKA